MSPGSSSANGSPTTGTGQEGKQGRKTEEKTEPPFDVWDLILSSSEMKNLLTKAQQSDLPQQLASYVEGQEMESGELSCVQLLICQTAPVLRKMQSSVSGRIEGTIEEDVSRAEDSIEDTFMKKLPSIQELRDHGHECEKRYPACDLNSIVA